MVTDKPRFRVKEDGSFEHVSGALPLSIDDMKPMAFRGNVEDSILDGDKFFGGFGSTQL